MDRWDPWYHAVFTPFDWQSVRRKILLPAQREVVRCAQLHLAAKDRRDEE
jgi:hypothetical protein